MSQQQQQNGETTDMLWDILILTVRNSAQKRFFELQLSQTPLRREYYSEVLVIEDYPDEAKIGSGGATLNALVILDERYGGESVLSKRVLILHSGGFCIRLPHAAAFGKAFMGLPEGRTFLEHKLESYCDLLRKVGENQVSGGFVFIASADVLEHFGGDVEFHMDEADEIALIAHESPMEVAEAHGVYVLDEAGQLRLVLQKPREDAIRQAGAVLRNGLVLTDSCYLIRGALVREMIDARKANGPVLCELCAYADFLCPLGATNTQPNNYKPANSELHKWQKIMKELMSDRRKKVVNLGPDSFFHLGTPNEMLEHFLSKGSIFMAKFMQNGQNNERKPNNVIHSKVEKMEQVSERSFVEWSRLNGKVWVEDGCIISGVVYDDEAKEIRIKKDLIVITMNVSIPGNEDGKFVTVVFNRSDDLKMIYTPDFEGLNWFGHFMECEVGSSLWSCPLFPVCRDPCESLKATLEMVEKGQYNNGSADKERISIEKAVRSINLEEVLKHRSELRSAAE